MRARPQRPITFQGDLRNLPEPLDRLKASPNWVCWRWEPKIDKNGVVYWTKPPYRPEHPQQLAKSNDPSTWGTYEQALVAFEAGRSDGIGFNLFGTDFAAFDIDNCRDPATGTIAPEAMAIVDWARSYTEMTVSGTGLRVIGYGGGTRMHRKQKIARSPVEVESYRGAERYIVITANPLPGTSPHMANIDSEIDAVVAELDGCKVAPGQHNGESERDDEPDLDQQDEQDDEPDLKQQAKQANLDDEFAFKPHPDDADSGDVFLPRDLIELVEKGVPPQEDLSAAFHHAVCWLADCGWSAERIERQIAGKPIVPERYANRLGQEIARCLHKARSKAGSNPCSSSSANSGGSEGVSIDDFHAFMPKHMYIFAPTGEMWPASSINSRLPRVPLKKKDGTLVMGEKPSVWLDKHRPVEQMTWAPGEPRLIRDRLIAEGGWIERPAVTTFNLYRPPTIQPGNSASADRWVELVHRIYPDDAGHIITFCAHRIQYPAIKINHGIILSGAPGIGKDTMLEPLKHGVGPWNFKEVSPQDIMSDYNDFMRCVVLRISEAHDLGDINRYAFYDHMKTIQASPPDVIRINGKYIPQHYVPNVAGVVYTTNHRFDSVYLPADDRRTYVAWSESRKEDFTAGFWPGFWHWYRAGGLADVVAYLTEYDLSKFDPKAPPKKTEAFWKIVGVGAAPENAELADVLDALGAREGAQDADGNHCGPMVVPLAAVRAETSGGLFEWLDDRKNRRVIPHRFEACGYIAVRNPDATDGLWKIGGKRQAVYGRQGVAPDELIRATRKLT